MFTVNRDPSDADLRGFRLASAAGSLFLFVMGWTGWAFEEPLQVLACGVAAAGEVIIGLSLWSRPWSVRLYVGWMTVGVTLGKVMSTVLLSVLFVTVVPLFSLIRLTDPLRKRLGGTESYWEEHPACEPTLDRLRRPF